MNFKKTNEAAILELFRNSYPEFPKGVLIPSESPDFILRKSPKKRIGIELTRISRQIPDSGLFTLENISACLKIKEEKLRLYKRKKLSEYWLILVAEYSAEMPRFNLNNKLIIWKFDSGFSKVFIFFPDEKGIYELNTK